MTAVTKTNGVPRPSNGGRTGAKSGPRAIQIHPAQSMFDGTAETAWLEHALYAHREIDAWLAVQTAHIGPEHFASSDLRAIFCAWQELRASGRKGTLSNVEGVLLEQGALHAAATVRTWYVSASDRMHLFQDPDAFATFTANLVRAHADREDTRVLYDAIERLRRGDASEGWKADLAAKLVRGAEEKQVEGPRHFDVRGILKAWITDGPLVHEPMAIESLDNATGGGPVYGSRWYLLGAPDAGKTALLVQTADRYLAKGIVVGLLAVDEDPDDVFTRFWQRRGFARDECERRSEESVLRMLDRATELDRLRVYDSTWTIERAADDLKAFAASLGQERAFLGVDSIQTVRCDAEAGENSLREQVTARAGAIRSMATKHRMIVMATSEMSRGSYRSIEAAEATDDLASAKESGAIEYSARVMLALRSVPGEQDLLELRIAKNKHGPRGDRIGLRLNRRLQELTEGEAPAHVERVSREETLLAKAHAKNMAAAVEIVRALLQEPRPQRALIAVLRVALGSCSAPTVETGLALLGGSVVKVDGYHGPLQLDGRHIPASVLAAMRPDERVQAAAARPAQERPS